MSITPAQRKSLKKLITEARQTAAKHAVESDRFAPERHAAKEAYDKAAERLERALDKLTITESK